MQGAILHRPCLLQDVCVKHVSIHVPYHRRGSQAVLEAQVFSKACGKGRNSHKLRRWCSAAVTYTSSFSHFLFTPVPLTALARPSAPTPRSHPPKPPHVIGSLFLPRSMLSLLGGAGVPTSAARDSKAQLSGIAPPPLRSTFA
jgi:hypothetical protein